MNRLRSLTVLSLFAIATAGAPIDHTRAQETVPPAKPRSQEDLDRSALTKIDPRVWCLYEAKNGDLWFGSNGNGVYCFGDGRLTHHTSKLGLVGDQVRDIKEGKSGHILVSTNSGVSKFDGQRWTELKVESPPKGGGWRLDPDDVWIVVRPGAGGPCRYDGEKLYRLELLSKSPAEEAVRAQNPGSTFAPDGVYSIYKDRRGHLWFGTACVGLARYDGKTLSWIYEKRLTDTPSGGSFGIRSIFEDKAGDFWICNTRQRFRITPDNSDTNPGNLIKYRKFNALPHAQTDDSKNFAYYHAILQDDAGAIWMACGDQGVWKYDGKSITRHAVGEGAYVISLLRDQTSTLWAGTLKSGLFKFNGERFEPPGQGPTSPTKNSDREKTGTVEPKTD